VRPGTVNSDVTVNCSLTSNCWKGSSKLFFIGKQAASGKLAGVLERKGMNGLTPKTLFHLTLYKICMYLVINVAVFLEFL
jgi:hypothetical protein